jgi:hypothetical protein
MVKAKLRLKNGALACKQQARAPGKPEQDNSGPIFRF